MNLSPDFWIVVIGLGLGSFALRFAFLGLVGDRPLPEWLLRHLRYTAVAFLPALVAPLVVWPDGPSGAVDWAQCLAGLAALSMGYWRRDVVMGVLTGVAVLFLSGLVLS